MKFDELIKQYLAENEIPNGKADNMTPEEIARKHNVPVEQIEKEIRTGIEIEFEHTDDKSKAREIAMDHLVEFPDYYTRLHKMEKQAKKGLKETMTASNTFGGSPNIGTHGGAVGNSDWYAPGDTRIPKVLGGIQTRHGMLKKKKKKKK